MMQRRWPTPARLWRAADRVIHSPSEFAQALVAVTVARTALAVAPFPRVLRAFQTLADRLPKPGSPFPIDRRHVWFYEIVARSLRRDGPCLSQAVALHFRLRRDGVSSTLRFGVRHGESGEVEAHAWLEQDGKILVGGPDSYVASFTPLDGWEERLRAS